MEVGLLHAVHRDVVRARHRVRVVRPHLVGVRVRVRVRVRVTVRG